MGLLTWMVFGTAAGRILYCWFHAPYGSDELQITLGLFRSGIASLNPTNPDMHPIGAGLGWLLMKVFPPPLANPRLIGAVPAVVVSILLLFFLKKIAEKTSKTAALLVLLPFVFSPVFLRHSHSLKGYSLMMLASLGLAVLPPMYIKKRSAIFQFLFGLIICLGPLVHTFLGFLSITTVAALAAWTYLNKKTWTEEEFRNAKGLLLSGAACLVSALVMLLLHAFSLAHRHELGVGFIGRYQPVTLFPYLFGIQNQLAMFGLFLFFVWVVWIQIGKAGAKKTTFLDLYLVSFIGAFTLLYLVFRPSFLAGRFFLGLVPPLLLWSMQSFSDIERRTAKQVFCLMFLVIFCLAPALSNHDIIQGDGETRLEPLESFSKRAQSEAADATLQCFEFSGLPDKVDFLRELYLPRARKHESCTHRYRVVLGNGSRSYPTFKDLSGYEQILRDPFGNVLYRKKYGS